MIPVVYKQSTVVLAQDRDRLILSLAARRSPRNMDQ